MLRKNTAGQTLGIALVSKTTGDAVTGASITVYRSIDGGAQVSAAGSVSEKGNGQYCFSPTAADLNGNQVSFLFVATGAVIEERTVVTTAADPTDSQRFGLTALPASGTLAIKPAVTLATADVSGNLPANLVQIAGQTASAASAVTFPSSIGTSTFAGGAVASVTAAVNLNLAQTGLTPRALDAIADGALTVGDALVCALASAAGKESVSGTSYTVRTPSTGTVVRTFTLDSATNPTTRT